MNRLQTLQAKAAAAVSTMMLSLSMAMMNPAGLVSVLASESAKKSGETGSVDLDDVTAPIIGLLHSVTSALIPLVAAVGGVYCVLLGVKFAKAEEPQEREKAKSHLRNAIIGFVLIFVLVVALNQLEPIMNTWLQNNATN